MAKTALSHPFEEIHGSIGKDKVINRRKKYRDDRGHVIHEGIQEAYTVRNPRDYRKNPPAGAELEGLNRWSEACRRAAQVLFVARYDLLPAAQREEALALWRNGLRLNDIPEFYTLDEARSLHTHYRARYEAQLPGIRGRHADPQAPLEPRTGTGKRYVQFPAFLRAMLYLSLKSAR